MYHILFPYPSIDGHVDCSQFLAILNKVTMDTVKQVSLVGWSILWV